ncbi:dihydroneopterin aldolase [Hoeflea marina]|uniref:7,8-dihydroneopterin aldolase n=1 Tax=Hoeflea marina TaxID=274592 RepID=A0A317PU15_9HYPH|nr:dihydroneopterin aldolase [Hoeflea marina]PWW04427.1 dihydroneopterin aldolase [Hoeflea marina]
MADTYTIRLKNCAFFARHGLHEAEKFLGQRFFVDAELEVVTSSALEEDSIADTVNYGEAFNLIEAVVMGERFFLIEALALKIARSLVAEYPQITEARITVRKPSAPVTGILDHVEVTVAHRG